MGGYGVLIRPISTFAGSVCGARVGDGPWEERKSCGSRRHTSHPGRDSQARLSALQCSRCKHLPSSPLITDILRQFSLGMDLKLMKSLPCCGLMQIFALSNFTVTFTTQTRHSERDLLPAVLSIRSKVELSSFSATAS